MPRPQARKQEGDREGGQGQKRERKKVKEEKENQVLPPIPTIHLLIQTLNLPPLGHQGNLLRLPAHLPAEFGPSCCGPLSSALKTQFLSYHTMKSVTLSNPAPIRSSSHTFFFMFPRRRCLFFSFPHPSRPSPNAVSSLKPSEMTSGWS